MRQENVFARRMLLLRKTLRMTPNQKCLPGTNSPRQKIDETMKNIREDEIGAAGKQVLQQQI